MFTFSPPHPARRTARAALWQTRMDLLTGGGFLAEADINVETVVDGRDIQPFVDNITGAGGNPIPEPATMTLLGLGGAALLRRRHRLI